MVGFTLRDADPYLLGVVLLQINALCWAIAIIRQFEFILRSLGYLRLDQSLSIQELVNNTPKESFERGGRGVIIDIRDVRSVLVETGTVLEHLRPFSQSLNSTYFTYSDDEDEEEVTRYRPANIRFYSLFKFQFQHGIVGGRNRFYDNLRAMLDIKGAVTARIPLFHCYYKLSGKDIYCPTKYQIKQETKRGMKRYFHFVLLTGHGFDEFGHPYFEFQDTNGVQWCDGGFGRVSARGYLISLFVEIIPHLIV